MLIATSPNNPNANNENAIVTTPSALNSGDRREAVSASCADRIEIASAELVGVSGAGTSSSNGGGGVPGVSAESKTRRP